MIGFETIVSIGRPIEDVKLPGPVAQHEAVLGQVIRDRLDRPAEPFVVSGQKAEDRRKQLIGAVIGVSIAAGIQIVVDELTAARRAQIAAADAAERQPAWGYRFVVDSAAAYLWKPSPDVRPSLPSSM